MEAGTVVEFSGVHTARYGSLASSGSESSAKHANTSRDLPHKIATIPILLPPPSTSHSKSCHWDVMQKSQPAQ
jgi:hypothetical protein